jgi:hypothetical protein
VSGVDGTECVRAGVAGKALVLEAPAAYVMGGSRRFRPPTRKERCSFLVLSF